MADLHTGPLAVVRSSAVFDQRISHAAFRVLAALMTHADEHGVCYPRQDPLAHRLGISQQAVSRSVMQLVKLGYLEVRVYKGEGETHARNHYRILFDEPLSQPAAAPVSESPTTSCCTTSRCTTSRCAKNIPVDRTNQNRPRPVPTVANSENRENLAAGSARPRDPLFDAAAEHIAPPETTSEKGRWGKALKSLRQAGATPAQIHACCRAWLRVFPDAQLTITALEANWSLLKGKVNGNAGTYQGHPQQVTSTAEDEAAHLEALRRFRADLVAAGAWGGPAD